MAQPTDDQLLRSAVDDREAFAAFYRRYEQPLLAFFLRRTRDPELAADLTAEVFAAALSACPRYQPRDGSAAAWLFSIAAHKLADSLRRGRVEDRARRRLGMEPIVLDDEDLARVEHLGDEHAAAALLHSLPARQRDAVVARVLHEASYAEIAGRLRCSESVVRKRVSRGLGTMRAQLREENR